jgi:amidohydrolase
MENEMTGQKGALDLLREAEALKDYSRDLRRDFHRHPELGYQEVRTAGIVARQLEALGLEPETGVAETGVVALMQGAYPGPVLLLRFDMDALAVTEETGKPYASENHGVMHACGHDGHMAIGLTVARLLNQHRDELQGSIKFVFQPAEEGLYGAKRMIEEGVLEDPRPDYALAMHVWNEEPLGWIAASPGPVMAAGDIFDVKITGKGGHGAVPHLAVDPVLAAAHVVTAVQSITARNVSPLESAVVSVTFFHGGEAFNVIPPQVKLQGTIRTFKPQVRQRVLERFNQVVAGVGQAMGCQVEVDVRPLTPAVVNDPQVARLVRTVAEELWPDGVVSDKFSTMGSEDMAFMLDEVPGCFVLVGSANPESGLDAPHHHPQFDFDETVLTRGAALIAASSIRLLEEKKA